MLLSLLVRNIALIDHLTVTFGEGLHVLTGETGAGKSILVDALALVLGGKASKDLIRTGCDKAYVEAVFDVSACTPALDFLHENELDDGDELNLSREITVSGRSSCRVNGTLISLSQFRALTATLMDIHGQHEHQSLMDEKQHMKLLDAFGDDQHRALLDAVRRSYYSLHDAKAALKHLEDDLRSQKERQDILRFQQHELSSANLVAGEEDDLIRERDLNRNAEKIESRLREAYQGIYDGGAQSSALDGLRFASTALHDLSPLDPKFEQLYDRVQSLYYDVEDIGLTLRDELDSLHFDEDRMDEIMTRLDLIRRLSRKYGKTTGDMLEKLDQINASLENIDNADEKMDELEKLVVKREREYAQAAEKLTASRQSLAKAFESRMVEQLNDLNMRGTRFVVSLKPCEMTENGMEMCAFMISPNRGEAMQPLAQTASGGELSRMMLAIKSIAADQSLIPSMVFDEIDTGISGRTAQVVAEKMADIARFRQVLCVTHLPQIAAMAGRQYLVEKGFDGERTVTTITQLDQEGRVKELSRMLGGVDAESESARTHAREMLRQAKQYQKNS